MIYAKSYDSITKKVLNESSGELEPKEFHEVKYRKQIKGGFGMFYRSYEEAVENLISSKLDFTIWLEIKNQFTYARIEVVLSATELSKKLNCSRQKVSMIIGKAADEGLIMQVSRGTYRLNPFMVLPFRSNGEELQKEWNALTTSNLKQKDEEVELVAPDKVQSSDDED